MDGTGRFPIGAVVRDLAHMRGVVCGNANFRPKGSDLTASDVPHVLVDMGDWTVWVQARWLTVEP